MPGNTLTIRGFEESNGTGALVPELVDGPTLGDRIAEEDRAPMIPVHNVTIEDDINMKPAVIDR